MLKMRMKKGNFKAEGWVDLLFENCPKCDRANLRYPVSWKNGASCPSCKSNLVGIMLFDVKHHRKHYHQQIEGSLIHQQIEGSLI